MLHGKKHILLMILLLAVCLSQVQGQFRKVATTGYAFLEIPVPARFSAMGEIQTAFADAGAAALFGNPGQLGFTPARHSVHMTLASYLADTRHQALGYVWHHERFGVIGLSINYLDMGEMTETVNADPLNPGGEYIVLGSFRADGLAMGLAYGRQLTNLFSFGVNVRYVRERIARYDSDNLVFDMGMVYHTGFRSLRLGGYIQNFGVDSKYLYDTFKMPMIFRLGLAGEVLGSESERNRITLAVEALHPSNYSERIHVGAEYSFNHVLFFRAGYKFNYDLGGLSLGLGLQLPAAKNKIGIDIAYTDFGDLNPVLRFSINAAF